MSIPFIDLQAQYKPIKDKILARINDILDKGQYIGGPQLKEFEEKYAQYVGVKHAIGCSSGTDALLLALMAFDIGPGDEVIVPDFSFFATSEMVSLLGATPVFVEINPYTYNMDVDSMKSAITNNTKAIMPVSLYGQCANLDEIMDIATANNIPVIEDAAQSFGAKHNGKRSCGITTIGCTSFYPSKPVGAYGDGGAIFTNDDALALKMRQLLNHGQESGYHHTLIGINGRLDAMQAAVLIEKLAIFDDELEARQKLAKRYSEKLSTKYKTPTITENNLSAFAQYTIEVDNRDSFRAKLGELGVPTAVHYPASLSKQPVYAEKFSHVSNPKSDAAASRVVSLPFHPYMDEETQDKIIKALLEI
jgi:UDP-2-acetamido-2-deoxy-ribo-hexuluronate aminotransferase